LQVDEAWRLKDDEADEEDEEKFEEFCVSKLHRWRTLRLLKKVKDDMGAEKWAELKDAFATVRHSGFADDEIDGADVPLFARKLSKKPRVGEEPLPCTVVISSSDEDEGLLKFGESDEDDEDEEGEGED